MLFRSMSAASDGLPVEAASARALGVRPGVDVPASFPHEIVAPGQGGISVAPDDPVGLPLFRRPPGFGGSGKDPIWELDVADLGPDLVYRPDPASATHGFIEPARPMSLSDFERAISATRDKWRLVPTPTSS